MKSYHDAKTLYGLIVLALFASFVGAQLEHRHIEIATYGSIENANTASVIGAVNTTTPPPPHITLGFVGDIMLDRNVRKNVVKKFGGDYSQLFTQAGFLSEPDITFANLEGPISNQGKGDGSSLSFEMDPAAIPALKAAGIDIVSVANNHAYDHGHAGFEDSLKNLKAAGILTCGGGMTKAEAATPAVITQDGMRIGFICFSDVGPNDFAATDTKSGILLASDPDFDMIVRSAAQNVNVLIVSFHWGVEYQSKHTARQEALAQEAIDDGAAMVEGEHPHVSEDSGTYKNAPIYYSLGNFIFDQPFSKDTMQGIFLTASIDGIKISSVTPHTVVLSKDYVPSLQK